MFKEELLQTKQIKNIIIHSNNYFVYVMDPVLETSIELNVSLRSMLENLYNEFFSLSMVEKFRVSYSNSLNRPHSTSIGSYELTSMK